MFGSFFCVPVDIVCVVAFRVVVAVCPDVVVVVAVVSSTAALLGAVSWVVDDDDTKATLC